MGIVNFFEEDAMLKLIRPVVLVLACGLLVACSDSYHHSNSSSSLENPVQYVDNSRITANVKAIFVGLKGIDSTEISVNTQNGVVYLTGAVDNEAQIQLAGYAAATVFGVKKVVNDLILKPRHC